MYNDHTAGHVENSLVNVSQQSHSFLPRHLHLVRLLAFMSFPRMSTGRTA